MTQGGALAAAVEAALAAERTGLASAWIAEHHSISYGVCPSAIAFAANLLGRTDRITVGTAVCMLSNRHPVALAEETALLDHLSGGRFGLGVGRGGPSVDLEASAPALPATSRASANLSTSSSPRWNGGASAPTVSLAASFASARSRSCPGPPGAPDRRSPWRRPRPAPSSRPPPAACRSSSVCTLPTTRRRPSSPVTPPPPPGTGTTRPGRAHGGRGVPHRRLPCRRRRRAQGHDARMDRPRRRSVHFPQAQPAAPPR